MFNACFESDDSEISETDDVQYETTSVSEDEAKNTKLSYVNFEVSFYKKDQKKHASYRVYVDGERITKVEVGKRKSFQLYLTKGEHKIFVDGSTLFSDDKSSEETFVVSSDVEYLGYKIIEKKLGSPSLEEVENTKENKQDTP